MHLITNSDTCASTVEVRVSVAIRGGHTGDFNVKRNGSFLPKNADNTVTIGAAGALAGTSILVTTSVVKIAAGDKFQVDHVLRGLPCGPFIVQDSFAVGDPMAVVEETIAFS